MESELSQRTLVLIKPKNVLFSVNEVLTTKYSKPQTRLHRVHLSLQQYAVFCELHKVT